MGPQGKLVVGNSRYTAIPAQEVDQQMGGKERLLSSNGSGSVSGSPGRLHDNVSRDSGIGCLKDGGLNTSGEAEGEIPQKIFDSNDKTSYLRGKFLGKGGFARVHELKDLNTNERYAGKIIHKSRISKPHHKEKISREIELHASLSHRNVVQFFKHFEDSENIYIMLENCTLKSLVHVQKARVTVTEPEMRYYLAQLCEGVAYIHQQQIIHRDLKLGNLFLTSSMAVKIGDFGLATRLGQEKKGTICGTPNYISPEVLNKEGHGFPADVWALGCCMFALLVGAPPFETSTLKETYSRIAENHYTIPDSLSKGAYHLIKKLLHPNPKQRPSVTAITQDLFFSSGLFPTYLPPSCCSHPPNYSPNSLTDISSLTSSVLSLTLPTEQHKHHNANNHNDVVDSSPNKKARSRTRTAALYEAITSALMVMPPRQEASVLPSKECPVFITKWIDYSNKYGFGFQLSDRSVGVLFNDNTRISYSADRTFVQFGEGNNVTCIASHQVPKVLEEKFTLLRYFSQYMDENLTDGGEGGRNGRPGVVRTTSSSAIPQIKRWIRTPKAIIMHLTNGTIQVNYFKDHTKLIVGGERQFVVTYINSERQSRSWSLPDLARRGALPQVRERMTYVGSVLEEFVELDEQVVSIK